MSWLLLVVPMCAGLFAWAMLLLLRDVEGYNENYEFVSWDGRFLVYKKNGERRVHDAMLPSIHSPTGEMEWRNNQVISRQKR